MKKSNIYILLSGLLLLLSACNEEEFLTRTNPNTITTDLYWQSPEDFESGLAATYGALQFRAVSGDQLTYEWVRGDIGGTEPWYPQLPFRNLTFNDNTEFVTARWNELYVGIFRANQVLENLLEQKLTTFASGQAERIEAQARFLRGMYYFWLVNTYNGAIVHTEVATDGDDFAKPFSSKDQVYNDVIIPDFEFALANLPQSWPSADDLGRVTTGTAASMLGKVHLFNGNWAEAAAYFKQVIDSGVYELTADVMDNFTDENEFNSESIFEVSYSNVLKPGISAHVVDNSIYENGTEATALAQAIGQLSFGGFNVVLPSYYLHELFINDEIDPAQSINAGRAQSSRTYATIVPRNGDGMYYGLPIREKPGWAFGQSAYIKKFTNWYQWDQEDPATLRSGINFRHIRLADVYLMYAEAILNRDGEGATTEAMEYIDRVRSRAGVLTLAQYMDANNGQIPVLHISQIHGERMFTDPNAEALLTHLRRVERPLELCFEGHRWVDLVRWGMVKEVFEELRADEVWREQNIDLSNPVAPLFIQERIRPDFKVAADNYNPAAHDYFPIPTGEVQSNPEIQ